MPKKYQIPSLEELALRSVGKFVTDVGRHVIQPICTISIKDPAHGIVTLHSWLEWIKQQLVSSVPWYLYDRMSVEALKSVLNLINETKNSFNQYFPITTYLSEMNVVVNLTEVVVHSNLKTIEFSMWPKIMRHVLYNNLPAMTGLEILDLGSGSAGWKTSGIEKMIIRGVSAMPNLMSFTLCFDCTDSIVTAVGQNCPKLQKLDVTASRSVTDRCLTILQKCWQLREIQLFRTSVSIAGYAELMLEHSNLEDIGRCDEFGYVLEHVRATGCYKKPFNLKVFESRDVTTEHLHLLVEMCPHLTRVSIVHDETINDLLILAALNNLTELKLLCCDFFTDRVRELLETKGSKITSLHLEHVNEIDLNALVYISQFCPKLKNLVLYNCEFLEHAVIFNKKLFVPPFKYLERIKCVADCAHLHLEFLLSHCINIKFIQLGSSTGIGDDTMARVLSKNPMNKLEELKILYSDDLSMKTVRLLMQNCDNLRRLSELESWQGISMAELDVFQNELRMNNVDLDISPTLSLALVVTIDLKEESFTPGKKNYEHVRSCLRNNLQQNFNVILAWDPPDDKLCPSSVAAWFHKRGYNVKLCRQTRIDRNEYSIKIPVIDESTDHAKLFEWLGVFGIGGDLDGNIASSYVNSYECPEPSTKVGQLRCVRWTGFITRKQTAMIFDELRNYIKNERMTIPWGSIDVQGFTDSPISWELKEHNYFIDGDNSYTIFIKPNGEFVLRTSLSSNNKTRIFQ